MNLHRRRLRVLAPVIAVTAGGLLSRAQDAPVTREAPTTRPAPPSFTGPGGRDGRDARAGANTRPSTESATEPATKAIKLSLNFKDAPLDTVLDYLSDQAGFVVVKEGPVDGRVTALSKQPVSREEAVTILNAALKANGFAAIQSGRQLKIISREKAKKGSIPVHFGEEPADVADTDELITQVIPIHNVDATKLRQDLTPLVATDADITANDGSNTIVMTDTSSSIRRIVQIIHDLDLEETTVSEMRIVQLKFANAAETVKLIDAIFKPDEAAARGGNDPRQQMMQQMQQGPVPAGGAAPSAGGSSHRVRGHVIAAADDRTNTLILNGPADALKIIDGLLLKLDSNPVPASIIRSFPLKYADAETTSKLVTTIFTPQQDNGGGFPFFFGRRGGGGQPQTENKQSVTASFDDRTNTVIVTAAAEAMKEIEGLIHSLDANPVSASDIKVFTLKYADADAVAKLINAIFNPTNTSGSREVVPFFIFGGGPAQSSHGAKVNATSDYRTNTLIATAPAETMKVIEGIIKQLDSNPAAEDTLFIYHLRNAQSANLETVLNTLFGNVQNGQGNNSQQNQNQTNRTTSGFGGAAGGSGSSGRGLGQNTSTSSNANRNAPANNPGSKRPGLSPGMAQAANELSGQVFVVADQDTNSLIVTTATKYEKQVRDIIHELDRPVPQVLIKVLVAEVTHDNSADWGADYSILNTRANKLGQTFGQTFGAPANGLLVSVVENQLNVTLHALAVEGKLDVLSRPYILASDNQLAEILVGSEVPLINNSYVTELGQTINSFQYQKVGIILDVTPHINPEGLVIMDVAPEISQLTDQSVPVGPGVSAPVIADRSAQTRVGIRDGQTIVIGGLMADSKTTTINKIPILGDIPVLKYLFSRTQVDKTKTELLIFITPHVAQQADVLQPMTDDEVKGTKLTPRAVEPGVFDEHLRGMQRGEAPATRPANAVSPIFEPGGSRPPANPSPTWSPTLKSDPASRPASSQPAANGGATNAPAH